MALSEEYSGLVLEADISRPDVLHGSVAIRCVLPLRIDFLLSSLFHFMNTTLYSPQVILLIDRISSVQLNELPDVR